MPTQQDDERPDLRLPLTGVIAWLAAVAGHELDGRRLLLCGLGTLVLGAVALGAFAVRRRPAPAWTLLAWLAVAGAVAGGAALRGAAVAQSPVTALAADTAAVTAELVVSSDPRTVDGRFDTRVLFDASVRVVRGRGHEYRLRAPVLVLAPATGDGRWQRLGLGARIRVHGRLAPADAGDLAGLLHCRGTPRLLARPGPVLRGAAAVRAGVRAAVADRSDGPRGLVPALVTGDDARMSAQTQDDFRATGLSHLLAVSGTNLTLVVGFLLALARGLGLRARALPVVGCLGVAGFVLLARAEPSVLRAAVMGTVGLLGTTSGRGRGVRAWGACLVALMLLDPGLSVSAGFALSALATAGILLLAPGWREALARWSPRWLAEAIVVPLAAQVACTPLLVALFGRLSAVAVPANLFAAIAVGPATVLGLLGGLVAVVSPAAGELVALPGAWSASWIIAVAHRAAALPRPSEALPTGPLAVVAVTCLTVVLALRMEAVLRRRASAVATALCCALVVVVPVPRLGWPPGDWLLVVCDVGQGDGLVLNAGAGTALVVDTGPDPGSMDGCLRALGVRQVPLVVLTHFHADHVDGLAGVLRDRSVGAIEVSPYAEPAEGAEQVRALAAEAGIPVTIARPGEARTLGPLRWQVLAPTGPPPPDSGSPPNDASVVLFVRTGGVRMLLLGDQETGSQRRLAAEHPGLRADVLKVAHHGSAKQDPALIGQLGARVGLISVGEDNDYGHPAPSLLTMLGNAGIRVFRTDRDGALAVVGDGGPRVVTER